MLLSMDRQFHSPFHSSKSNFVMQKSKYLDLVMIKVSKSRVLIYVYPHAEQCTILSYLSPLPLSFSFSLSLSSSYSLQLIKIAKTDRITDAKDTDSRDSFAFMCLLSITASVNIAR